MKVRALKNITLILLLGFLIPKLEAQETYSKVTSDFESWNSVRLKAKFNKNFTASFEQGLRLSDNAHNLDQALSELELAYKLTKGFEIGIGTRYIYDRTKNDDFENNFRLQLDASYKQKVNRLDFKARLRLQNKSELDWGQGEPSESKSYLRLKLQSEYNFKNWKLDPQISAEVFRNIESSGEFDKVRMTIGTNYSLKKAGEIGIFYRLENEINTILPKTTYITGLKYTYTFKPYKK